MKAKVNAQATKMYTSLILRLLISIQLRTFFFGLNQTHYRADRSHPEKPRCLQINSKPWGIVTHPPHSRDIPALDRRLPCGIMPALTQPLQDR
jgi:hypothetical protein